MHFYQLFWIDSALSLVIAVYLIYVSWDLLMQTLRVLMQFAPADIDISKLVECSQSHDSVDNVHHIHVWQLTDQKVHFEGHIDFREDRPLSQIETTLQKIAEQLKEQFGITHTTLQPEINTNDSKSLISDL